MSIIFGCVVAMIPAQADEDVSLVLWMEDTPNADFGPSLTIEKLERAKAAWQEMNVGPVRLAFIPYGSEHHIDRILWDTLKLNDRVTNIIFVSHGKTDLKNNRTSLSRLGTFGTNGATGSLQKLFHTIRLRLSPDLGISMIACKTLCGTEDQVQTRVKGLADQLAAYGVRRLSVWGSPDTLSFDEKFNFSTDQEAIEVFKKTIRPLLWNSALFGMVIAGMSYIAMSNLQFDLASFKVMMQYGLISALTAFPSMYFGAKAIMTGVGTRGFIVTAEGGQIKSLGADANSKNSYLPGRALICHTLF